MTLMQEIITVCMMVLGTMTTRFLPFLADIVQKADAEIHPLSGDNAALRRDGAFGDLFV